MAPEEITTFSELMQMKRPQPVGRAGALLRAAGIKRGQLHDGRGGGSNGRRRTLLTARTLALLKKTRPVKGAGLLFTALPPET